MDLRTQSPLPWYPGPDPDPGPGGENQTEGTDREPGLGGPGGRAEELTDPAAAWEQT